MLRFEAPRVRLPPAQEECCAPQQAAISGDMTMLSLAALGPVGVRVLVTVFRIFFPLKGENEAAFLTRRELKRIKLG